MNALQQNYVRTTTKWCGYVDSISPQKVIQECTTNIPINVKLSYDCTMLQKQIVAMPWQFWTFQNCRGASQLVGMMKLTSWTIKMISMFAQEYATICQMFDHHSQSAPQICTVWLYHYHWAAIIPYILQKIAKSRGMGVIEDALTWHIALLINMMYISLFCV